MSVDYYVHSVDPFALRFSDGAFIEGIRWYGIFYIFSFLFTICALNFYTTKGKSSLSREQNLSFLTHVIVGVIAGGRFGYMFFYYFDQFVKRPWEVFAVWNGGMSSHGGFIGVILAMVIFCKRHGVPLLPLADVCCTIAPFGLFLGRMANFVNGELYGKITNVKWAMIFPKSSIYPMDVSAIPPRHPSQLYEALLEGLVLFLYMQFRFWSKKDIPRGRLSGEFLVIYAVFRIFSEVFREPDADLILSMSRGQFYSIFLLILGIILIIISRKKITGEKFSRVTSFDRP
jgi:phosphatidylglycerol:prolipoprotein diacylglycerol transferase